MLLNAIIGWPPTINRHRRHQQATPARVRNCVSQPRELDGKSWYFHRAPGPRFSHDDGGAGRDSAPFFVLRTVQRERVRGVRCWSSSHCETRTSGAGGGAAQSRSTRVSKGGGENELRPTFHQWFLRDTYCSYHEQTAAIRGGLRGSKERATVSTSGRWTRVPWCAVIHSLTLAVRSYQRAVRDGAIPPGMFGSRCRGLHEEGQWWWSWSWRWS